MFSLKLSRGKDWEKRNREKKNYFLVRKIREKYVHFDIQYAEEMLLRV